MLPDNYRPIEVIEMTDQVATQSGATSVDAAPTQDSLAAMFKSALFGEQPSGQAEAKEGEKAKAESGESPEVDGEQTIEQVLEKFKVPALEGDGIEELTAEELKAQRLMQADYTRKTQQVAEERKAQAAEFSKRLEAFSQREQAVEQNLQMLGAAIQSFDSQVNWDALRQADPSAFLEAREQQAKRLQAFEHSRQQIEGLRQARRAEVIAENSQRLMEAMPELLDQAAFKAFGEKVTAAGQTYGFTPQEIAAVEDHRMLQVLSDAAKFRELQSKAGEVKAVVAKAPQMAKPGAPRQGNAEALKTHRLVKQATEAPSRDNLQSLFKATLGRG